jgi:hypothetical protein
MAGPLDSAHAVAKLPAQDLDRARRVLRDRLGLEAAEERDSARGVVRGLRDRLPGREAEREAL